MKFAILFGGNSYEHEISIVSAMSVAEKLGEVGFIYCSYDREFYEIASVNMKASYFAKQEYKKLKPLQIASGGFLRVGMFSKSAVEFDVLINLVHGKDGEDGTIAGLLEFYEINYIGARVLASAISYDKAISKDYAKSVGVAVLDAVVVNSAKDLQLVKNFPVIAKPARLGSSIGIAIAKDASELEYAYESAKEFDEKVVFEHFISGVREINLAGYRSKNSQIVFSKCEEPKKTELLNFDDKYLSFKQREAKGADLSDELVNKLRSAFDKLYSHVFDGALIRCDFFIIDNEVYLNEINPHPGSLANYLFDDFAACIKDIAIVKGKKLGKEFEYLNKIVQAK